MCHICPKMSKKEENYFQNHKIYNFNNSKTIHWIFTKFVMYDMYQHKICVKYFLSSLTTRGRGFGGGGVQPLDTCSFYNFWAIKPKFCILVCITPAMCFCSSHDGWFAHARTRRKKLKFVPALKIKFWNFSNVGHLSYESFSPWDLQKQYTFFWPRLTHWLTF